MFRRLWVPAIISSVGWALSDMADSIVLGQKMGTVGLATIGLILPVYMVESMLAHGIGLGGSVRYARLMGEGKREEAKKNFSGMFILALIVSFAISILGLCLIEPLIGVLGTKPADGALFSATKAYLSIQLATAPLFFLSHLFNYYLRNDGSEKRAGAGSVIGNITDISLNFLFVLALEQGTGGAALATAIGQIVSVAIYLPGLFSEKHSLRFGSPSKGWFASSLKMLRSGLATSVSYLYQMVFFLLCNNILIRMNGGSEVGIAVFDIIQSTSYLVLYLYEGTARAMQPILSTYHGEQNEPGRRSLLKIGFTVGVIVSNAIMSIIAVFPELACMVFGVKESSVKEIAFVALRFYAIGAFFAGISILICNYYQSYEREKPAFLIGTLRGVVILIPATLVCSQFGQNGFWCLFPITEILSLSIGLLILFIMRRSGKNTPQSIAEDRIFRRTIPSTESDIGTASSDLEEFCERWEASPRQQYSVMMTVEELGLAILQHGFEGRDDGYIQITVIACEDGDFELRLRDDARTFDPFSLNTSRASSEEDVDMDSIGVLMIKERSKEFNYRRYQGFNSLFVKI